MKKVVIIIGVVLLVMGGWFYYIISEQHRHEFKVWFLNIGQGDSALIQFENGETMLVDCGANRKVLSQLGAVVPFYVHTIDYVLATHPDLDHYGGCVDVLKRYDVKHIIVNGRTKPYDPYWREWDKAIHNEGAEIITMTSPTVWTIASDTLQFLSPDPALKIDTKADDSNNYSIVFRLTHGAETFLFTGDMEVPLENALLEKYCPSTSVIPNLIGNPSLGSYSSSSMDSRFRSSRWSFGEAGGNDKYECPTLRSDILKVGHHGSPGASGEDFLTAVRAKQAVISVGPNRYGHPSLRVIKHLERAGAEILRTDQRGAILVR
ncbi:MAG: MBL fold metallo-hydrolase [Candidatus Magasanikbacteria bacterium]|nr:MBL fold metallo-hydrolase [Candidatus Magasanikbacteria bacterium]